MITIKKVNLNKLVIYNIFLFIFLASSFYFYQQWTNTLERNGNWQSSKMNLMKEVMGSSSFVRTYRTLAFNHLDLGTWFGFQEVFYRKPINLNSLSFDFKLSPDSYFTCYYSRNQDTLSGIRISNSPDFTSSLLRIVNGEFIEKKAINIHLKNNEWNTMTISYLPENTKVVLNNVACIYIPQKNLPANVIGFRGCEKSTLIDNIAFKEKFNNGLFYEDFSNKNSHGLYFIFAFLLANMLYLLLSFMRVVLNVLVINISIISLGVALFFGLSGQNLYPKDWMIDWDANTSLAKSTEKAIKNISDQIKSAEKEKNSFKIMFIGTSQTWGAGATTEENTFVRVFEKIVHEKNDSLPVLCINNGISGINSTELLKLYADSWVYSKPDFCIIDLSCNDGNPEEFRQNLEKFVQINNTNKISTIFILEPMTNETQELYLNHNVMREVAESYKLQAVDMQSFITKHIDDGYLYWDRVHLTDFGQKIFAAELYNQIYKKWASASIMPH